MPPFQPKGDRSLRSVVVSMAASAQLGDLLSYENLAAALKLAGTGDPRPAIRSTITAARPVLLRDYGRVLLAQRGQGYRIGLPGEIATVAQSHRGRADRQMSKALAVVTQADTTAMSQEEYQRFTAAKTIIVGLHNRMTSVEDRMARIESAVFGPPPQAAEGEVLDRHDAARRLPERDARSLRHKLRDDVY